MILNQNYHSACQQMVATNIHPIPELLKVYITPSHIKPSGVQLEIGRVAPHAISSRCCMKPHAASVETRVRLQIRRPHFWQFAARLLYLVKQLVAPIPCGMLVEIRVPS